MRYSRIPESSCLYKICKNACLMGKTLKRLKDMKRHPTMVHE